MVEKKALVIHGPNLNMLGKREPLVYGTTTLAEINETLTALGRENGIEVETFQSNHEGAIVEKIQSVATTGGETGAGQCHGLIINPAAYTHTSVAIRDAVALLDIPVIEVHLSNIYARETFRHKSLLSDIVNGHIAGLGACGYAAALRALVENYFTKGAP